TSRAGGCMGAVAIKHGKHEVETKGGAGTTGTIVSRNPATGAVLGEVPEQGPDEIRAAVARAREAQRGWRELSVVERGRRVLAFRDAIARRADEICDLISRECGKPRDEALAMEVIPAADLAGYFAKRGPEILAPQRI